MFLVGAQMNTTMHDIIVYSFATGVGAFLIWIGRSIARMAKNQSAIHDQVMGKPEIGYPSMRDQFAEIRDHLYTQDRTLEKLEHEVQDNSGSSLKDAVKSMNRDVIKNGGTLNNLEKKVNDIDSRLEKHVNDINNRIKE